MKTLVVARDQEDTRWYAQIPPAWALMEVPKDGFLAAILQLYDRLEEDDLVAFVQGDPFSFCQDIDLFLLLDRPTDGFRALGDYTFVSGGDGSPNHPGLAVADEYERLFGRWPGVVRFAPGGQFVATGRDIRARPLDFYQSLLASNSDPLVLERLWPTIFEQPQDLKATFYCQATPITTYLRCELPARYLPGKVSREIVRAQDDQDFWYPDHEGAAILQFAGDASWALNVHGLQTKGVRVLMESDDNYFTVAPRMKATSWGKTKQDASHSLEGHASILKWVDGCIVTTEYLAKQYRKHCPNVWVAPNTVDPLDWPQLKKRDDGILRIGWFASSSHIDDAKLVHRAMEWASRQPDVEVWTMGYRPPWRFPHRHVQWQDLPGYREALHELDIGVAPIVGTPWALCRSDLKALEYSMAGVLPVVSEVAPYELFTHGENCLKAKDAGDFYKRIRSLVQNRGQVKPLAKEAKEYVLRERTTEAQIDLWRQAVDG